MNTQPRLEKHELNWRTLLNAAVAVPLVVGLIGLAMSGVDHAFYKMAPYHWWASYQSVDPSKDERGFLYFYSSREAKRDVLVGGSDTLYCLTADDVSFTNYSSAEWGPIMLKQGNTGGGWRYPEDYPPLTSCRLVSDIYYEPAPGYRKWQRITGDVFTTPAASQ